MSLFESDQIIVENHTVLEPETNRYTPPDLPERERELNEFNRIIRPLRTGGAPHNALIYGPTGQGKTVAINIKMDQIQEWAEEEGENINIVYVRCKGCESSYHVLTLLVKRLREAQGERGVEEPQGHPKKTLVQMVFNEIEAIGGTVLLILDEIDGIGEDDYVLYELSRPDLEDARLGLIGITNDAQFRSYLDADVQSSFGNREIYFHPYDANQLRNILARRAVQGLRDTRFVGDEHVYENLESDVLDEETLPVTAARASNETGDARQAIRLFREACETAEDRGHDRVTKGHVVEAHREIEKEAHREMIASETLQRRLALASVLKHEITGNPNPGTNEIYRTYLSFCNEIDARDVVQRTIRGKLNDLSHQNILTKTTRGRGQGEGVSNFYATAVDTDLAIEALSAEDSSFDDVVEVLQDLKT